MTERNDRVILTRSVDLDGIRQRVTFLRELVVKFDREGREHAESWKESGHSLGPDSECEACDSLFGQASTYEAAANDLDALLAHVTALEAQLSESEHQRMRLVAQSWDHDSQIDALQQTCESRRLDGDKQLSAQRVAAPDKVGRDSDSGIGAQVRHGGGDDSRGLSLARQDGSEPSDSLSLPRWSVRYGGAQLPPVEVADPAGVYVHVGDVVSLEAHVRHLTQQLESVGSTVRAMLDELAAL